MPLTMLRISLNELANFWYNFSLAMFIAVLNTGKDIQGIRKKSTLIKSVIFCGKSCGKQSCF